MILAIEQALVEYKHVVKLMCEFWNFIYLILALVQWHCYYNLIYICKDV